MRLTKAPTIEDMPFRDIVRPLLIAPAASIAVEILFIALFQQELASGLPFLILVWWVLSLAAASLFVLPMLLMVPRLRRPPMWLATIWGAITAWIFATLFAPGIDVMTTVSPTTWGGIGVAGAASGLLYAFLVRRRALVVKTSHEHRTAH